MNLLQTLEAEQIAELAKELPDFAPGDTVRVGYKVTEGTRSRVQNYEGVVIARNNGRGSADPSPFAKSPSAKALSAYSRSTRQTSTPSS